MSPEVETITGKRNNPCHRSLLKHAGKIKDNNAVAARRRPAAGPGDKSLLSKRGNFCRVNALFFFLMH